MGTVPRRQFDRAESDEALTLAIGVTRDGVFSADFRYAPLPFTHVGQLFMPEYVESIEVRDYALEYDSQNYYECERIAVAWTPKVERCGAWYFGPHLIDHWAAIFGKNGTSLHPFRRTQIETLWQWIFGRQESWGTQFGNSWTARRSGIHPASGIH